MGGSKREMKKQKNVRTYELLEFFRMDKKKNLRLRIERQNTYLSCYT
jgi:hypothetical protein